MCLKLLFDVVKLCMFEKKNKKIYSNLYNEK